jgi:hypothetical protein
MRKLWILLFLAGMLACEKELAKPDALGENALIIGTWVEEGYVDDVLVLDRAGELDPGRYGFIIREDGSFLERKNEGWCGTPPISYDNFEGSWEALSDSLLEITVGYWGGTMSYQMRIVRVDSEQLGIRYLYGDNTAEAR